MRKTKNNAALATKHAPAQAPAVAEVEGEGERVVDDDFEGEVPAIAGGGDAVVELETVEEEFEVEAPAAEVDSEDGDSLAAPKVKQPSDKEIEEGGGDSMLARYFREMATHTVMGPDEELETADRGRAGRDRPLGRHPRVHARGRVRARLARARSADGRRGHRASRSSPSSTSCSRSTRSSTASSRGPRRRSTATGSPRSPRPIRLADSDRLWIAHAEEIVRKLGEEPDEEDRDRSARRGPQSSEGHRAPRRAARRAHGWRTSKCLEKMSEAAAHSQPA